MKFQDESFKDSAARFTSTKLFCSLLEFSILPSSVDWLPTENFVMKKFSESRKMFFQNKRWKCTPVTSVEETEVLCLKATASRSLIVGKCSVSDMRGLIIFAKIIRNRHLPGHVGSWRFPLMFQESAVPYDCGSVIFLYEKTSGRPVLWNSCFWDRTR